jgi:mono/diheme cytochrome c family protein
MAIVACAYGLLKAGSIWYPINLLAAVAYAQSLNLGPAELKAFHLDSFAIAVGVHGLVSTLVGLLYGAMLPMFPRRPIVLGGLVVPVLWSGPAASHAGPAESVAREPHRLVLVCGIAVAFGVVAGAVVVRRSPMATLGERLVRHACGRRGAWNDGIARRGRVVTHRHPLPAVTLLVATVILGCGAPPGQPRQGSVARAPEDIMEFDALYAGNCAGCHGPNGRGGAALALANPVYLAIVDPPSLRATVAAGVRGTSMPAFAKRAGGMLTEQQIDALVDGIQSRWSRPDALAGATAPSYTATTVGDIHRGEAVYQTFCQSCHGPDGRGGPKGSAITNGSFLALASDQGLRTAVIAGRPELGAPDWRGRSAGLAMSDQGRHRRGELARLAPRCRTRPAVLHRTGNIRSVTCRMKLC